jgi:rubrerythrin
MGDAVSGDGARLLADIPWEGCSATSVDPQVIQLLIAACLVESRGDAYGAYLERVFSDDPEFVKTIKEWSIEENEHGIVLANWLGRVVPEMNISSLLAKYNQSVNLSYSNSTETVSIRGSKTAELLSRCAVESGTSTYYKAIAENVEDPALQLICMRLAKDEINHYSVFRKKLDELRGVERFSSIKLLRMSLSRLVEFEDDQVSYAYYIGMNTEKPYSKKLYSRLMIKAAYGLYNRARVSELVKLNLRAYGLPKSGFVRLVGYDRVVSFFTYALFAYIRVRLALINLKLYTRKH